jgi:hypothetical protein
MIAAVYVSKLSIPFWPAAAGIVFLAIVVWWFLFRKGK